MFLSKEAVDVYTHRTTPVQDSGRQPRFAAALDNLLQTLLKTVVVWAICSETTHRSFNFTDALKVFQVINSLREIYRQLYLMFDSLRIALAAQKLHRHPQLQRVEPARAHLPVTEEVKVHVSTATIFIQVLRRHIKRFSQHARAVAHERSATRKRHKHPLVRIERDRIGAINAAQHVFVLR